jgi:hypothetical protein
LEVHGWLLLSELMKGRLFASVRLTGRALQAANSKDDSIPALQVLSGYELISEGYA